MIDHIDRGDCVGGGRVLGLDEAPLLGRFGVRLWSLISTTFRLAAGSFVFCRADAFHDVGGFDEELYAVEELALSDALKKWGRRPNLDLVILRKKPHVSSGRKFYLYSHREIFLLLGRAICHPNRAVREKQHLDIFYDGRR